MKKLTLYHKQTCPFCIKVLRYVEQNGINIPLRNVADVENYEELVKIGGKSQVPCLVIDGKALYESDDIIQWFENSKKEKEDWIENVHNKSTCS